MKYVGSKARLVKYIAPIIQSYIDENNEEYIILIIKITLKILIHHKKHTF